MRILSEIGPPLAAWPASLCALCEFQMRSAGRPSHDQSSSEAPRRCRPVPLPPPHRCNNASPLGEFAKYFVIEAGMLLISKLTRKQLIYLASLCVNSDSPRPVHTLAEYMRHVNHLLEIGCLCHSRCQPTQRRLANNLCAFCISLALTMKLSSRRLYCKVILGYANGSVWTLSDDQSQEPF